GLAMTYNSSNELYSVNWGTGALDVAKSYRIEVWAAAFQTTAEKTALGFRPLLGWRDIQNSPSTANCDGTEAFCQVKYGRNIPVKARIQIGALCDPPGLRPCNSATLEETVGGDVAISTDGGSTFSGVHQPGQPPGSQGQRTITVQQCLAGDLNPRATHLMTVGSCITVSAIPVLTTDLTNPATVEVCDLAGDIISSGLSEEQEQRLTMHRLDGGVLRALPHVAGCAIVTGSTSPTFRSVLKEFARGNLGGGIGKLASLVGPAPLNARRRRINLGGGGSPAYSDFGFALPCKMAPYAGNAQTGAVGALLPTEPAVLVTDLAGDPCPNTTVLFATADGTLAPTSDTTGPDGIAKAAWTLGPNVGAQSMTASGKGIAVVGNDGPRSIFDPFMAIQPFFNPANDPVPNPEQPVIVQTGVQSLTANGIIPFGSGGYSYKQVASSSASPANWQLTSFNEAANGFTVGTGVAPFASSGTPCNYTPGTAWAKNTDILVRKTFTLASAATVQVRVAVDRYAKQVYLNGVLLNPTTLSWNACAVPGAASNFILTGQGSAGSNLLTVRASARSQSAFLDLRVAVP
ncbi:MAG TPA: Ig-like domain-containing protein, partial [Gemmatimonadales bacterium]|nr:Ig-like domain-containing protein [Gemmatimonadales bacterium]